MISISISINLKYHWSFVVTVDGSIQSPEQIYLKSLSKWIQFHNSSHLQRLLHLVTSSWGQEAAKEIYLLYVGLRSCLGPTHSAYSSEQTSIPRISSHHWFLLPFCQLYSCWAACVWCPFCWHFCFR